jgi:CheY-like chemotaxis protein
MRFRDVPATGSPATLSRPKITRAGYPCQYQFSLAEAIYPVGNMTDTLPFKTVAVVAADLIFDARIRGAADEAGINVVFARNPQQLRDAAAGADLVILDLDARWLDPNQAIRSLRRDPATSTKPIVAFVSHVRADAIEAARNAGADRVLARSAFVKLLPSILAGE